MHPENSESPLAAAEGIYNSIWYGCGCWLVILAVVLLIALAVTT